MWSFSPIRTSLQPKGLLAVPLSCQAHACLTASYLLFLCLEGCVSKSPYSSLLSSGFLLRCHLAVTPQPPFTLSLNPFQQRRDSYYIFPRLSFIAVLTPAKWELLEGWGSVVFAPCCPLYGWHRAGHTDVAHRCVWSAQVGMLWAR